MRPSSAGLLIAMRCLLEAALFATLGTMVHQLIGPASRPAPPLLAIAAALWGAAFVLCSLLREERSERSATGLAVAVLLAGAVAGVLLDPDARGIAILTRVVAFGALAEAYLWRTLSIARDGARWHEARNAWLLTSLALGLGALLPDPFDQLALVPLALATVVAGGAALSLARATEELRDEGAAIQGDRARPAAGAGTIILGAGAIIGAVIEPIAQDALGPLVRALDELIVRAVLFLIWPVALLAGWLTELFRGMLAGRLTVSAIGPAQLARERAEEEANLQALEAARPFVIGVAEVLLVLVALGVAILLIERMVRERRASLPLGATLERTSVDGIDLADLLGALRGTRTAGRRAPHSDGSPAAMARLLYWRFLRLAERAGPGWRAPEETPAEHAARLLRLDARWGSAAPVLGAFTAARYGERDPDPALLKAAQEALSGLEGTMTPGPRVRRRAVQ